MAIPISLFSTLWASARAFLSGYDKGTFSWSKGWTKDPEGWGFGVCLTLLCCCWLLTVAILGGVTLLDDFTGNQAFYLVGAVLVGLLLNSWVMVFHASQSPSLQSTENVGSRMRFQRKGWFTFFSFSTIIALASLAWGFYQVRKLVDDMLAEHPTVRVRSRCLCMANVQRYIGHCD